MCMKRVLLVAAVAGYATAFHTGSDWIAFAAGALVGALAVLVPFATVGSPVTVVVGVALAIAAVVTLVLAAVFARMIARPIQHVAVHRLGV